MTLIEAVALVVINVHVTVGGAQVSPCWGDVNGVFSCEDLGGISRGVLRH